MAGYESIYTVEKNSKVYPRSILSKATFLYMKDTLLFTRDSLFLSKNFSTYIHHQMYLLCSEIMKPVRDYLLGVYNLR